MVARGLVGKREMHGEFGAAAFAAVGKADAGAVAVQYRLDDGQSQSYWALSRLDERSLASDLLLPSVAVSN